MHVMAIRRAAHASKLKNAFKSVAEGKDSQIDARPQRLSDIQRSREPTHTAKEKPVRMSRSHSLRKKGVLTRHYSEGRSRKLDTSWMTAGHKRLFSILDAMRDSFDAELAFVYIRDPFNPNMVSSICQSHVYKDVEIRPPSMIREGVGITGSSFGTGTTICAQSDNTLYSKSVDRPSKPNDFAVGSVAAIPIFSSDPENVNGKRVIAVLQFLRQKVVPESSLGGSRHFSSHQVEQKLKPLKPIFIQCIEMIMLECKHHLCSRQAIALRQFVHCGIWLEKRNDYNMKCKVYDEYENRQSSEMTEVHEKISSLFDQGPRSMSLKKMVEMFKEIIQAEVSVMWLAKMVHGGLVGQVMQRHVICHESSDTMDTMPPTMQPLFGIVCDKAFPVSKLCGDKLICERGQGIVGTTLRSLETTHVILDVDRDGEIQSRNDICDPVVDIPPGIVHKPMSCICVPVIYDLTANIATHRDSIISKRAEEESTEDEDELGIPIFDPEDETHFKRELIGVLEFSNKRNPWGKREFFDLEALQKVESFAKMLATFIVKGCKIEQKLHSYGLFVQAKYETIAAARRKIQRGLIKSDLMKLLTL